MLEDFVRNQLLIENVWFSDIFSSISLQQGLKIMYVLKCLDRIKCGFK